MLQGEFERGTNTTVGKDITTEQYEVIERCYNTFDYLFKDKQDVYKMYRENGMDIFERLDKEVNEVRVIKKQNDNMRNEIADYLGKISEQRIEFYNKQDALVTENAYLRDKVEYLIKELDTVKKQTTTAITKVIESFLYKEEN